MTLALLELFIAIIVVTLDTVAGSCYLFKKLLSVLCERIKG